MDFLLFKTLIEAESGVALKTNKYVPISTNKYQ
jgi:hypothetical protein